jgi:hypothetical protein
MQRSRVGIATVVLGVAGLVACASARVASTDGGLGSPTPFGTPSGLICRYATDNQMYFSPGANTDVDTPAPMPAPSLRASITLTPIQAISLSALVAATSIAPVTGTYACPEQDPGHEALVVPNT